MAAIVAVLVLGSLATIALMIGMCWPGLFTIGGKSIFGKFLSKSGKDALDTKKKAKPKTPKDIMAEQIEKLTAGQVLKYKVPESWGGDFIVVELNPAYPEKNKSKKYLLEVENIIDGKPGGKRNCICDMNKPLELAKWVIERQGVLYTEVPEVLIAAAKIAAGVPEKQTAVRK